MRIWNEIKIEEEWDQKLKVEIRRLKQRGYDRKYKAKLKAKNQKLKRMIANANQEQAARKVENKKPRTVSYPTTEEVWGQREHAAARSLWRVRPRLRAERASDQSP